jgi:hypothetical protein
MAVAAGEAFQLPRAPDHPLGRERLQRPSAAVVAVLCLRGKGCDVDSSELERDGHGVRGVSFIPSRGMTHDSRAGMELAQFCCVGRLGHAGVVYLCMRCGPPR